MNSAILQQVFVVEYVVQHQMCEDCHRREAQDFWRALVQIRQKVWGELQYHGSISLEPFMSELEIWHCTQVMLCNTCGCAAI
jgi:hypothetical protein